MTAFNREEFLPEAIESVIKSNYTNYELIIVDDKSTDNTVSIAQKYASTYSQIRLYVNEYNLGDYPNRNRAASYANGDVLIYVDSDDTIRYDALSYIAQHMECNPSANFAVVVKDNIIEFPTIYKSADVIRFHFFKRKILNTGPGGIVIRSSFFKKMNGYSQKYGPANDLFSHVRFACETDVLLLPYVYLNYRVHSGQESNNQYLYFYNSQPYINDLLSSNLLPLSKKEINRIRRYYSLRNFYSIFKFIIKTFEFQKGFAAFKAGSFKLSDFI